MKLFFQLVPVALLGVIIYNILFIPEDERNIVHDLAAVMLAAGSASFIYTENNG